MNQEYGFQLNKSSGYFKNRGVDVMAFDDIYPVRHPAAGRIRDRWRLLQLYVPCAGCEGSGEEYDNYSEP